MATFIEAPIADRPKDVDFSVCQVSDRICRLNVTPIAYMKSDQTLSTRKSLAWSFSQEGIQKAVRFAGSIAIARLLTPDEVGIFSIAMAASFLLNAIQDFGVGTYLIREPQITKDKIRTVFGLSIFIQWSLGIILIISKGWLSSVFEAPGIVDVLTVIAFSFFIGPIGQPALALIRRDMRFDILHHIGVTSVVVGTVTTILLAILGFSYMSMAWGYLAGNIVRASLAIFARPDHLALRPGYKHWREVAGFGGWLTAASFAMTATTEGVKFVLGGFLSPGNVALFERADQVPRMARQAIFIPIGRVLIPSFSKDIREGVTIGPSVENYISALTAILWPMSFVLSLFSMPITLLLFGENWRIAGEIMPYVILGMAVRAALPTPNEILIPHGRVKRLTMLRAFQFCMTIGLSALGAMHSFEMFAIMQVWIGIIFLFANAITIWSFLETTISRLRGVYLKAAVLAVISTTPTAISYYFYGDDVALWVVGLCCIGAIPIWVIGIFAVSHPLSGEIRIFVKAVHRTFRRS